ncbi:alpha/beta-hydrolase [Cystobasidium minutum MCA 4210]|uniref:alpha/beta-hydrolase n=1 Tax=Cystobasidium minutum MCA 4210 TaxID=1397322 RepID=UPI0034CD383D|eukprot:jgi/Rhomi1/3739/CE3738_685
MNLEQPLATSSRRQYPQLSWFSRIKFWVLAHLFQKLVFLRLYMRKLPASQSPSFTKIYPGVGANKPVRVFLPQDYKAGDKLPPLWLDVHGGGFTVCSPSVCDVDNAILSRKHGFCVVSIPYRLAPSHPFPTPTYDCAAVIKAVLDDEKGIPADRSRVVLGGYSAGGNLSLSAAQLDGLHDRINAIVAYYPVVDYDLTLEEKLSTSKVAPHKKKDLLESLGPIFNWAYLPHGQDRQDPLLSPAYAERSKLPKNICLVGCEYDLLCGEAKTMAEKLAQKESGQKVDTDSGWEKGNIKWIFMEKVEHGFNQMVTKDPAQTKHNRSSTEQMHQETSDWVYKHVFA